MLTVGHLGKWTRSTWEVLKCVAGEGSISWIDRVRNEEVLLRVKGERNIVHTVCIEGRITGLVTYCVRTVF